jgi:hypothetical protein
MKGEENQCILLILLLLQKDHENYFFILIALTGVSEINREDILFFYLNILA